MVSLIVGFTHILALLWLDYKTARKQSYKTAKSASLVIKNLLKLGEGHDSWAREIVERSMMNNWSGIFPLSYNDKQRLKELDAKKEKANATDGQDPRQNYF